MISEGHTDVGDDCLRQKVTDQKSWLLRLILSPISMSPFSANYNQMILFTNQVEFYNTPKMMKQDV